MCLGALGASSVHSVTASSPISSLAALPDAALWTSRASPEFATRAASSKRDTVAILPVFGLADWGLGRPLDLEETLGTAVLRSALAGSVAEELPLLVLPPLRWVLGPYPHSVFAIDFETAHALVSEIAHSVHTAGVTKLVFLNSSPWNEELLAAVGVDLRVAPGLQTYCIHLAALGLDLHPGRAESRVDGQSAACACYGCLPAEAGVHAEMAWMNFRPGHIRQPGAVPFDQSLPEATRIGARIIHAAGRRLASLLSEIHAHRPGRRTARRTGGKWGVAYAAPKLPSGKRRRKGRR